MSYVLKELLIRIFIIIFLLLSKLSTYSVYNSFHNYSVEYRLLPAFLSCGPFLAPTTGQYYALGVGTPSATVL